MARMVEKLSPTKVQRVTKRGLYGDGAGLWLHVGPTGSKSWVYRFMLDGAAREMGLGPLHTIGLAEARRLAAECRRQRLAGVDPLAARKQATAARRAKAAKAITCRNSAEPLLSGVFRTNRSEVFDPSRFFGDLGWCRFGVGCGLPDPFRGRARP